MQQLVLLRWTHALEPIRGGMLQHMKKELITFCMHQMWYQFRKWWTSQIASHQNRWKEGRCWFSCYLSFVGILATIALAREKINYREIFLGRLHRRAWFCRAQIEIMLISVHTGWWDWRNIGYTVHITYSNLSPMLWKWLRINMAWILNLYCDILIISCILVNMTKLLFLLVVKYLLLLSQINIP